MSSLYAMWVDGTNVCAQREGYFISKAMTGRGAIFQSHTAPGSKGEWFQWAIPTPVIVGGTRAELKRVFVFYQTEGTAKIMAVHVYDMAYRIASFENLNYSGNHFEKINDYNKWPPPKFNPPNPPQEVLLSHKMQYGLGISVLVDFGPASKIGVPKITFFGAGADFQV